MSNTTKRYRIFKNLFCLQCNNNCLVVQVVAQAIYTLHKFLHLKIVAKMIRYLRYRPTLGYVRIQKVLGEPHYVKYIFTEFNFTIPLLNICGFSIL